MRGYFEVSQGRTGRHARMLLEAVVTALLVTACKPVVTTTFNIPQSSVTEPQPKTCEKVVIENVLLSCQLQKVYNVSPLLAQTPPANGSNQTVAIFAESGIDPTDLSTFDPTLPSRVNLVARKLEPSGLFVDTDPYSIPPDAPKTSLAYDALKEAEGDIEAVDTMAPGATIEVYQYPITFDGLVAPENIKTSNTQVLSQLTDFMTRIRDNRSSKHHVDVVSISLGVCEGKPADNTHSELALSAVLQQVSQLGVPIFAGSGDTGSKCVSSMKDGQTVGVYPEDLVSYPASDPNVTAVGGTRLSISGNSYDSERPWVEHMDHPVRLATGYGTSSLFPRPCWQRGSDLLRSLSLARRSVPDVAAYWGDLLVYVGGEFIVFNGTSLAAPLWAGLASDAAQIAASEGHPFSGPANPILYDLFARDLQELATKDALKAGQIYAQSDQEQLGWGSFRDATRFAHDWAGATEMSQSCQAPAPGPNFSSPAPPLTAQTQVVAFEPWVPGPSGLNDIPRPGERIRPATGSCNEASAADPGRSDAYRCTSGGTPLGVCFVHNHSGDPGSPLLCSADPTGSDLVQLTLEPAGSMVPYQSANRKDLNAPPWFLVLADGHKCHRVDRGTDTKILSYDCDDGSASTEPDRSSPAWTVQLSLLRPNPQLGPPVVVVTAIR